MARRGGGGSSVVLEEDESDVAVEEARDGRFSSVLLFFSADESVG
jgi:hypothetical protein